MTPKICVTYNDWMFGFEPWTAFDENQFDGAPDGAPQALGTGKTQEEAIQDLLRQLTEEDETC
jgi:hypothetical protein